MTRIIQASLEYLVIQIRTLSRVALTSGTFALFEGDQSIHRVRPVGKTRAPRVIALLSYDRRPDQIYPQAEVDRIRGYTR